MTLSWIITQGNLQPAPLTVQFGFTMWAEMSNNRWQFFKGVFNFANIIHIADQTFPLFVFTIRHDGPVWQVAWSHPKFGVLLASCSYDGKVIVFREAPANNWTQIFVHTFHESSGCAFWFYFSPLVIKCRRHSELNCVGALWIWSTIPSVRIIWWESVNYHSHG